MTRTTGIAHLTFLTLFFVSVAGSANFTQCLIKFKDSGATEGGTDYSGMPVTDPQEVVALTYEACTAWCGTGQESFNWSVFSQQFSAWLLPWLALISQLPFGAESRLDNLISVALTVGSPTLAAFSLALTALNTRWAYHRFSAINYPNRRNAAKVLIYLQQVPLHITTRDGLLASLIVLPDNDEWWEIIVERLEHTHTWTIAAATSIAWVIIAFVFTIVDSFMNLGKNVNSTGQGVGSLWLWLIPIVVGWLWTPICSYEKLRAAIDKANECAYVASRDGLPNGPSDIDSPKRAYEISHMQAIRMSKVTEVFTRDAARTAPVFNYARIWEWWRSVEMIAQAFEHASKNAANHVPVNRWGGWVTERDRRIGVPRDNRTGTIGQVQAYCGLSVQGEEEPLQHGPVGVWKQMFIASLFALGLQWGTTGSAALILISTPTTGLGCRSGSYILYGAISTIIWLVLLLSSYLAHHAKVRHDCGVPRSGINTVTVAEGLATFFRRLSILAAGFNTLGIVLACVFQFSNFYSTCYCNSSVLGRGAQHAYNIIAAGYNFGHMKGPWIGGIVLAGGCVFVFLFFLHLMLEPSHDTDNH